MTRAKLEKQYNVNKHGLIITPGKFQGEPLYVPYFYEHIMDGSGNEVFDTCEHEDHSEDECDCMDLNLLYTEFDITDDDIREFPELQGYSQIRIGVTEIGFVTCELVKECKTKHLEPLMDV